jgi:threonine synthase
VVVATAHPAKFESIVEPLIGETIPVPKELEAILRRPSSVEVLSPKLAELRAALL